MAVLVAAFRAALACKRLMLSLWSSEYLACALRYRSLSALLPPRRYR